MKTRHAAQIRAGILLARQRAVHVAWFLTYGRYTNLTFRAYRREDARRVIVTLPPQHGMTTKPLTADVEESTTAGCA